MQPIDGRKLNHALARRDAFKLKDLLSAESLRDAHIRSSIDILLSEPQFEQTVEIEPGATDWV